MTHSVFAAPKTPTKNKLNVTGCKSHALVLTSGLLLLGCSQNSSEAAQSATSNAGPTQLPPQATVPAGEIIMGSNKTDTEGLQQRYGLESPLFVGEHPEHKLTLSAFKMDIYEVSNGQYKEFLIKARGKGEEPTDWRFNGYGLARSQADATDVEILGTIASEHFLLVIDTQAMD